MRYGKRQTQPKRSLGAAEFSHACSTLLYAKLLSRNHFCAQASANLIEDVKLLRLLKKVPRYSDWTGGTPSSAKQSHNSKQALLHNFITQHILIALEGSTMKFTQ